MVRVASRCLLALTLLAVSTSVASAQAVGSTLGVSYSFLRVLNGPGINVPAGWLVSFAGPLEDSPVAIVGEAAGNYRSEFGETFRVHTFQAGLRLTGRTTRDVYPFAQFLVGVMNLGCCGESSNHFAIEPGFGVDLRPNGGWGVRLGASFPFAFDDGDSLKSLRLQAGVVLPLLIR